MARLLHVCSEDGCPNLTTGSRCAPHEARSARNHLGVPRQARGLGAAHDRRSREFQGRRCELRLSGCTGIATSADHVVPRSLGGGDLSRPACAHCQNAQGAALARAAR